MISQVKVIRCPLAIAVHGKGLEPNQSGEMHRGRRKKNEDEEEEEERLLRNRGLHKCYVYVMYVCMYVCYMRVVCICMRMTERLHKLFFCLSFLSVLWLEGRVVPLII